jgi:hypothetical protein
MKGNRNDTTPTYSDEHGTHGTRTADEVGEGTQAPRSLRCGYGVAYTDCPWGHAPSCSTARARCLRYTFVSELRLLQRGIGRHLFSLPILFYLV